MFKMIASFYSRIWLLDVNIDFSLICGSFPVIFRYVDGFRPGTK
ncbi:MAG: hypothetical protein ACTSWN_01600 [Promethearchaeota archaeon]